MVWTWPLKIGECASLEEY